MIPCAHVWSGQTYYDDVNDALEVNLWCRRCRWHFALDGFALAKLAQALQGHDAQAVIRTLAFYETERIEASEQNQEECDRV